MANDQLNAPKWQDWAVLGLHALFIVGSSLAIYIWRSQNAAGEVVTYNDLVVPFGIGLAVIAALGIAASVSTLSAAAPYVLIVGDWVLAGIYIYTANAEPMLAAIIAGTLIVIGLLRLGPLWGAFHVIGVIAAALGIVVYVNGAEALDTLVRPFTMPMLVVGLLTLLTGVWVYVRDEYDEGQKAAINKVVKARSAELQEMRDRARAITEMSSTLSGTLNFEKILDAALDIGLLAVRKKPNQRIVSMVLLFRSLDESLYIASSRGLGHVDEHRILSGKSGIIAEALEDGLPIIGKNAFRDPELRGFSAFQGIRSILCIPLRAHYDNYGILIYGSDQPNAFNADHIDTLNAIGVHATVALQNAVLYSNLMEEKERIIQMEEDARKSLVRDLHDIPTQTISAVAMRIRIIMRQLELEPDVVPDELKVVEEMAMRATEEIRHVLFKLRPLVLESQGLSVALGQLAEKMRKTYNQVVNVKVASDVERFLDSSQQGALFYLIEEAVNNARKYAEASQINVLIARREDVIAVRIVDNGVGFDTEEVNSGYDERGSFGMVNMRERAELLDGTLNIKSVPGRGTTIDVLIPVDLSKTDPIGKQGDPSSQLPETKLALSMSDRTNLREASGH